MPRLLIASQNPQRLALPDAISDFEVVFATLEDAFRKILALRFDALVIDLAKEESIELINQIRATVPVRDLPILVIAEWGKGYATLALSSGADAYEPSPCDATNLIAAVNRLLLRRHAVAK